LGLPRSSWYYKPVPEDLEDLRLMRLLDEQYTRTPFYGARKMTAWLKTIGEHVNIKRVKRLMRRMGLEAIYPKPNLSRSNAQHRKYPYLLKGLEITRPNQVWGTDITYIRLAGGFVYLVAVLDWFSRYVVSWGVSVTLDVSFCLEALERALCVGHPEIFNSDQGVQFTCQEFTGRLEADKIQISMDGRGRAMDNVFTERLWRSVKYEEVYLKDYGTVPGAIQNLGGYFGFYNGERLHQALGYKTPAEIYFKAA
jgi:putative transposase